MNNFENVVNCRVDIREDIKRYRDTLSYASSKVDYSMGENIYMLPSDMNIKIKTGTVRYNNKILISDGKFSLGTNNEVNAPAMKSTQTATNSNDVLTLAPTITHNQEPHSITHNSHNNEKNCFGTASGKWFFAIWNMF